MNYWSNKDEKIRGNLNLVAQKDALVGSFAIKNVPAGVDLQFVAWHEQPGFFLAGGSKGDRIHIKEGENIKDLTIKAR